MPESNTAPQAGIIERHYTKKVLTRADFDNNDKLKFEIYKLVINEVFQILKNDKGVLSIPLKSLQDYKKGFVEIENAFLDFYRSILKEVPPDKLQPLIDQSSTKLTMAVYYKENSDEEECLNKLKECRLLLLKLVNILETIDLVGDLEAIEPPNQESSSSQK